MTATSVTAAVVRDRADALHASVDAMNAHRDTCTKEWCPRCTALARTYNATYQSALDAAAAVRGAR